jgi:hypothetical protein
LGFSAADAETTMISPTSPAATSAVVRCITVRTLYLASSAHSRPAPAPRL